MDIVKDNISLHMAFTTGAWGWHFSLVLQRKEQPIHMCHHVSVTHQKDLLLGSDPVFTYPSMPKWLHETPFYCLGTPPRLFPFGTSFSIKESLWSSRWQNGTEEDVFRRVLFCIVYMPSLPIYRPSLLKVACCTWSFPWNTHSFCHKHMLDFSFSCISWRLSYHVLQKWIVRKSQNPNVM